ncbi:MAG: hypothetical protein IH621_08870 [Krumholzibacteria bacterium]|nr:hypothetical protein [Candidatus Krumholzibacteria bacterium]
MVSAVYQAALAGLHAHQRGFARHAEQVAAWGTADAGHEVALERGLVEILQARRGYAANLAVVRAADGMLGTLLDVLA